MSDLDRVRGYYQGFDEREVSRLDTPGQGVIEFHITTERLKRYLPGFGRVLDVGGGPGRYTLWLAEQGYAPTLMDVSPNLLAIAREQATRAPHAGMIEEIVEGDARDLSRFASASFDAALCLGPMYHLPERKDREDVVAELHRVLKHGAPLFVAWMPRMVFLRRSIAVPEERAHLADPAWVRSVLQDGRFDNDNPGRFDHGYGARPQEIAPFMEGAGFDTLELVSAESFASGIDEPMADLVEHQPELIRTVLDLLSQQAGDPGLLSAAGHLLWVGRKRPSS